jgi:hypothetical protein
MRLFRWTLKSRLPIRRRLAICAALVIGPATLLSQTHSHQSRQAAQNPAPADEKVVLSIRHNCVGKPGDAAICQQFVTKQDFDALARALDPNMSAAGRQALAAEYARLLIMAAEARRRGLDRLPE